MLAGGWLESLSLSVAKGMLKIKSLDLWLVI
jgi:hypothetical protein